jgi:hypothetical protein
VKSHIGVNYLKPPAFPTGGYTWRFSLLRNNEFGTNYVSYSQRAESCATTDDSQKIISARRVSAINDFEVHDLLTLERQTALSKKRSEG